jgi:urease accessory protein
MRARTRAVVGAGGRLTELSCQPPLTLRQVRSEDADTCALCLVGTAAGPLAGDQLELELELAAGARATLRATGASLAQGRGIEPARLAIRVRLGVGAFLDADPGALIVATQARVEVSVEIELADQAQVSWREIVVLGRSNEPSGAATIRWDITRTGRPVLRQRVRLGAVGPDALTLRPARAPRRVLATAYQSQPRPGAGTTVRSPTSVAQELADGSRLATVLANDAAEASRELDALTSTRTVVLSPAG